MSQMTEEQKELFQEIMILLEDFVLKKPKDSHEKKAYLSEINKLTHELYDKSK